LIGLCCLLAYSSSPLTYKFYPLIQKARIFDNSFDYIIKFVKLKSSGMCVCACAIVRARMCMHVVECACMCLCVSAFVHACAHARVCVGGR